MAEKGLKIQDGILKDENVLTQGTTYEEVDFKMETPIARNQRPISNNRFTKAPSPEEDIDKTSTVGDSVELGGDWDEDGEGTKKPKVKIDKKTGILVGVLVGVLVLLIGAKSMGLFDPKQEKVTRVAPPVSTPITLPGGNETSQEPDMFSLLGGDKVMTLVRFGYNPDFLGEVTDDNYADKLAEVQGTYYKRLRQDYLQLQRESWDYSSDKFRDLLNNTYLGLTPNPAPNIQLGELLPEKVQTGVIKNARYAKMPLHGSQPLLKIRTLEDEIFFYQVPLERFIRIKDVGNIVIQYDIYRYQGKYYIENLTERVVD